jgi:hypothetical protein
MDGLELSTDKLDLAAPDHCDLTPSAFHEISRAAAALRPYFDGFDWNFAFAISFTMPQSSHVV